MDKQTLLTVKGLRKVYEDQTAIAEMDFSMTRGESLGIVGESGCGKSTLARLIAGLERPTQGSILFQGENVCAPEKRRKKCQVNMVFQNPEDSFDGRMTVYESLCEAIGRGKKLRRPAAEPVVAEALRQVELPAEYAKKRVSQLSGGECQRVAIARALLTEPELLICDEATSALDVSVQGQIVDLLVRLKRERGFSCLWISHDLALVAQVCSRVLVMQKGKVVEEGAAADVLRNPQHPYTRLLVSCGEAFILDAAGKTAPLPEIPE